MRPFEIILRPKLIGGHYAALDSRNKRIIGEGWRLDRACATELVHELNEAFAEGLRLREAHDG